MSRLPPPSDEQNAVIKSWLAGCNIVTSACAGAGKSTLIAHIASESTEPCLVLTYNKNLATEMTSKLESLHLTSKCYTFHGICSKVFGTTPDDDTMNDVLNAAEAGQIEYTPLPYMHVCIDEAQDMKFSYMRLIRLLFAHKVQVMLVGDEVQMIYTYDPDDSASLDFMQKPEQLFASVSDRPWVRHRLSVSFRLNSSASALANKLLDADYEPIYGVRPGADKVRIYTLSDMRWFEVIEPLLRKQSFEEILILCSKVRWNNGVTKLANDISLKAGCPIYISTFDSSDVQEGKLHISSWHSSKGTENNTCVVLGLDDESAHNAMHVALTRSRGSTIVVMRESNPNRKMLSVIPELMRQGHVEVDAATMQALENPPTKQDSSGSDHKLRDITDWKPPGTCAGMSRLMNTTEIGEFASECSSLARIKDTWEDYGSIMDASAVSCAQYLLTGQSSILNAILNPTCVSYHTRSKRIRGGDSTLFASHSPSVMLPSDIQNEFLQASKRIAMNGSDQVARDWLICQAAYASWGKLHYKWRQLAPFYNLPEARFWSVCRAVIAQCKELGHYSFFNRTVRDISSDRCVHFVTALRCGNAFFNIRYCSDVTKQERISSLLHLSVANVDESVFINSFNGHRVRVRASSNDDVVNEYLRLESDS